jgi:hypothetical protein
VSTEYFLVRHDTKTVFDLYKYVGMLDICGLLSDPEKLFHALATQAAWKWGGQFGREGETSLGRLFLIRDRLLDFVSGADLTRVELVTDWGLIDDDKFLEYRHSHDVAVSLEEGMAYLTSLYAENSWEEDPAFVVRSTGNRTGGMAAENNESRDRYRQRLGLSPLAEAKT